jgi:FkbH-like protein
LVKKFLPEVTVPEFPQDITFLNSWFWEEVVYEYFPKLSITKEDKDKLEQYKRNIKRKELQTKTSSYEDFLKSLNIKLKIYIDDSRFKTRLAQLTQKTNQFNLTTRRYTESDIEAFLERKDTVVYALEYEDIFGSEGIIGEAIIKLQNDEALIDTFLLSCRVIGRNVEFNFLNFILEDLKSRGIKKVIGEYIPTKKNVIVKDFYRKADFKEISNNKFIKEL